MLERETKRARIACFNCRRKKTRCSGERPTCAFCARLNQECTYEEFPSAPSLGAPSDRNTTLAAPVSADPIERIQGAATRTADLNHAHTDANLASRVAMLEAQLNMMNSTGMGQPFYALDSFASKDDASQRVSPSSWSQPRLHSTAGAPGVVALFSALPPDDVLDSLTSTYFQCCHAQPYWYFREANFRRRLGKGELPEWLLLAFVATAARFSDDSFFQGRQVDAVERYSQAAWREIHQRLFSEDDFINIHAVQAMNMLSVIDFTAGRHKRGWVKIGLSVRFAESLNLQSEPDASLPGWLQDEHRWTFWSVYLLDRLVSCIPRHKPTIQDVDCTLDLPRASPAADHTTSLTTAESPESGVTLAAVRNISHGDVDLDQAGHLVFVASALGRIQRCCLRRAAAVHVHPPWDCRSDFAAIQTDLTIFEARSSLVWGDLGHLLDDTIFSIIVDNRDQAEAMGVLCFSHMLYFVCQCLLNHPFLVRQIVTAQKRAVPLSFVRSTLLASRENAVKLTELLEYLLKTSTCLTSFSGYCAVVASVIHKLFQHDREPAVQDMSRRMSELTTKFLREAPVRWSSFREMEEVLSEFTPDPAASAALVDPRTLAKSPGHPNSEQIWNLLDYSWVSGGNKTRSLSTTDTTPPQDHFPPDWSASQTRRDDLGFRDNMFDIGVDEMIPENHDLDMLLGVNESAGGSSGRYQI